MSTLLVQNPTQLRKKIAALEALTRETNSMFLQIENDLAKNIAKYNSVKETVDVSAEIILLLVSLGKLVTAGMRATALHGKALEEANKELGKEGVKFAVEPVPDAIAKQWASTIGANDGHIYAFGKVVLQSFFDMTTPSFWAGVYTNLRNGKSWKQAVTEDPAGALGAALARVREQKKKALDQLNAKLADCRMQLAKSSAAMRPAMQHVR